MLHSGPYFLVNKKMVEKSLLIMQLSFIAKTIDNQGGGEEI